MLCPTECLARLAPAPHLRISELTHRRHRAWRTADPVQCGSPSPSWRIWIREGEGAADSRRAQGIGGGRVSGENRQRKGKPRAASASPSS